MADQWLTSDQHLWHSNIIRLCNRPWTKNVSALSPDAPGAEVEAARQKDVEEMNEEIIARFNAKVKPDDVCFHLGDFSMAFRAVELYGKRLNGKNFLIPGNHDFCHPAHKKARKEGGQAEWLKKYVENGFAGVLSLAWRLPNDLMLSHMPYKGMEPGDHGEKYAEYRPDDKGGWLAHGHVHTSWKTKGRMINVGVDVNDYAPVHMDEILAIVRKGSN